MGNNFPGTIVLTYFLRWEKVNPKVSALSIVDKLKGCVRMPRTVERCAAVECFSVSPCCFVCGIRAWIPRFDRSTIQITRIPVSNSRVIPFYPRVYLTRISYPIARTIRIETGREDARNFQKREDSEKLWCRCYFCNEEPRDVGGM